jgi:hypothetical protein
MSLTHAISFYKVEIGGCFFFGDETGIILVELGVGEDIL